MKLVIAGGTGFLGSPLAEVHAEEGHDVRVLTRSLKPGEARHEPGTGVPGITRVGWNPSSANASDAAALTAVVDSADVVVNLAGESIGDGRWTPQRKAQLRDSRIVPTRTTRHGDYGRDDTAAGAGQRERRRLLRRGGS